MTHPIGYYVDPEPAIAAIAEKYGQQFERMPVVEKLLTLAILTNTLRLTYQDPNHKIKDEIWNRLNRGEEVNEDLQNLLVALDGCSPKTLLSLLEAMIAQLRYSQYQSFE